MKHNIVFPVECKVCGKTFNRLTNLRMHIQKFHKANITYEQYMLKFYGIIVHKDNTKKINHNCKICGKIVKTFTGLSTHLKNNHVEYDYVKYLKENFEIDKLKYENDKIECRICGGMYLNLARHLQRTHADWTRQRYEDEYGDIVLNKNTINRVCRGIHKHSQRVKGLSPKERLRITLGDKADMCYDSWRDSMKNVLTIEWFIDKYGKEEGKKRYEQRSMQVRESTNKSQPWLHKNNNQGYSKISQDLFWKIYGHIKGKYEKVYFGELNHEYGCETNRNFDFVIKDIKKVIEFNGEKFHVNPDLTEEKKKQWKQVYTNKTAIESEENDKKKIANAKSNGYDVLVVWENEYKKNEELVIQKCLKFIGEYETTISN